MPLVQQDDNQDEPINTSTCAQEATVRYNHWLHNAVVEAMEKRGNRFY
jgi:hypothetical protein